MIAPSGDCSRATVWPHGSSRALCSSSWPACSSSRAAGATAAGSATSNSMLTCGTVRSAGQWSVPKQACAAWESGQIQMTCSRRSARCGSTRPLRPPGGDPAHRHTGCGYWSDRSDYGHGREELDVHGVSSFLAASASSNRSRLSTQGGIKSTALGLRGHRRFE